MSFELIFNGNSLNNHVIPILYVEDDNGKSDYFGLRQSFLQYYIQDQQDNRMRNGMMSYLIKKTNENDNIT